MGRKGQRATEKPGPQPLAVSKQPQAPGELRLGAAVGAGERARDSEGSGSLGSIPGLTITGSIIRPRYEEDALVEAAQALHLSQLRTVSCAYQHHTVTRAQQSSGLHEVFPYSLWVHLVQRGKVIGLRPLFSEPMASCP